MHTAPLFVVLAAAYLAKADVSLDDLPDCSTTPLENGIGATGCSITDFACICKNSMFVNTIVLQVTAACSAADQATFIQAAEGLCKEAGVTVNIPTSGASSSAAAPPATSEASTASTSTTSAVVTSSSVSPTFSGGATFILPLGPVILPTSSCFKKKKESTPTSSSSMGETILPVSPSSKIISAGAGSLLVGNTTIPTTIILPPLSTSGSLASSPTLGRSSTTMTTTVTSTLTSTITYVSATSTSTSTSTSFAMMPTTTAPYSTGNGSAMANTTNTTAMAFRGGASGREIGYATMAIAAALVAGTRFL